MKTTKDEVASDAAMMSLLKAACPIKLGTPGWLLRAAAHCTEHPYTLIDLVGPPPAKQDPDEPHDDKDLNSWYGFRMGYQFSWGSITEVHGEAQSDVPASLHFHLLPEQALQRFPHPELLCDVMEQLYETHPKRSPDFGYSEGYGSWDTLDLWDFGPDREKLRLWIHDVFLAQILPDLLEACERVADAFVSNGMDGAKQVITSLGVRLLLDSEGSLPYISRAAYHDGPDTLQ